jgi:hypothetical protein
MRLKSLENNCIIGYFFRMVECNETDKKLVLWKKLSAYATETLKELDISEVLGFENLNKLESFR